MYLPAVQVYLHVAATISDSGTEVDAGGWVGSLVAVLSALTFIYILLA